MTLLRSFGQVDEEGRIALGGNFMLQMGLKPDSMAGMEVVRITGSNRSPYLVVHKPDREPRFTALQTVFHQCPCLLDEEGRIILDDKVMAESGFEPGLSLEFKLAGPSNAPWLAIRNKGTTRFTTLQKKMGLKNRKKWTTMIFDY
ncbi:MAG: hypothetical protein Q7J27_06450 [Syntrophales bacterium]|nr:hypothetical protein [Syntrophales bacterium]